MRKLALTPFLPYTMRMKPLPVVYEDDNICIINKPSGLAVQGGAGVVSAVDGLLSEQLRQKVYLVHRLDKDTAGLLITAKNARSAALWTQLIGTSCVAKEYYALCTGDFPAAKGTIGKPIPYKGGEKSAVTSFCAEKQKHIECEKSTETSSFAGSLCFSLVRLKIGTGRMHQIRIHLAGQLTPIAGDDKYGDFKLNRYLRKNFGIKKLHLAAVRLRFSAECKTAVRNMYAVVQPLPAALPSVLEIPLPDYMLKTLALLQFGT